MYLKKELYRLIQTDESIFDFIQESSLDGLWYWDLENMENEWMSAKFWTVLGYNPDEMPHKSAAWQGIINEDDLKLASENFTRHCDNPNYPYDQIVRYRHKNGSTKWIRCRGLAIRDNTGKPIRMLGAHQDVTELKRIEHDLYEANEKSRESEEKYRAFYNKAPLSYQSLDENGCFIDINPMWEKTLGYERSEVIGKWYGDFLHPDYVEHFRINFPAFKKRGYVSDVQFKLRRKDNTFIYVSFEGCVGYTPEGKFKQTYCVFKDITEQKAVENALIKAKEKAEESEERFKSLHNASFGGIAIHDKGIILECNQGLSEMTGYSLDELIGMDGLLLIAPEHREMVMNNIITGNEKPYEANGLRKNGVQFPMRLEARTVPYKGKNVRSVEFRDITERKHAEEELSKLSQAVEQSPAVVIITNPKGIIEYVNAKFTDITGYTAEEAIGQNPRILNSGEQSADFYKELWKTISSGKEWNGELRNKKKNGELFWESAQISPIFNEKREIINYLGIKEDVTELKQAEKNFRHSIDESPLGIRVVNQKGKPVYVNQAFLEIYDFTSFDEYVNTPAIERYTYESYKEHLERKIIRKEGKEVDDYEISIRRSNGDIRHVKIWRKEVIWNKEKHFQVINQDITENKTLYNQLLFAKEKAEESDRLKSAFLANMSHEIRTPMNGILGFADLLKEPDLSSDKQHEYIKIIEQSGARMLNTINDIIDISKIEAGLMKLDMKETNINEQIEFVYAFFKPEAENKGIEFSFSSTLPQKEAIIKADSEKVYAILTNLVKNAFKYIEKGSIKLGCDLVKTDNNVSLLFFVKDTGIGIPKDRQEAIFERFIHADVADKMAYQGAGLGLAITKTYVEMLGGRIWVESEAGKGSTFYFTLPYITNPVAETTDQQLATQEKNNDFRKLKILVAEDDVASEMLILAFIKSFGKEFLKARTGVEAVDVCRTNPDTDLILMDIRMPEMNGYEATKQIRTFNKDVVIIAQTAFGMEGDREKSIDAGCNDYIAKPINKIKLQALIQQYFKK